MSNEFYFTLPNSLKPISLHNCGDVYELFPFASIPMKFTHATKKKHLGTIGLLSGIHKLAYLSVMEAMRTTLIEALALQGEIRAVAYRLMQGQSPMSHSHERENRAIW